jgi:hypothetical protein
MSKPNDVVQGTLDLLLLKMLALEPLNGGPSVSAPPAWFSHKETRT